jgi:hypothetical protein
VILIYYNECLKIFTDNITSLGLHFWTSGSNEGENCDTQNVFEWCSIATNIEAAQISNDSFWVSQNAPISPKERCLLLQYSEKIGSSVGVKLTDCEKQYPALCEVRKFSKSRVGDNKV